MAISPEDIARVRDATDIVALVSEQVALKRAGQNWVGLCPFHGEKSASFNVRPTLGRYHCFGCNVSGDAISWVMETQRLEFLDAVRLLADKAGIEIVEEGGDGVARKDRQEYFAAMEKAVAFYHDKLLHDPAARAARTYLKSRGINGEIAKKFQLGWAPDSWDALTTELDASPKVLQGTGLGFLNQRQRKQDFFRARIMFPIFDPSGKPVAFGGRIVPPAPGEPPPERQEAKYKNSPETAIYSKRRTLYALNWAKDDVIRAGEIIVCEGYTDVIAFFEAGLPRAVATCGTALAEDHFRAMKNFATRIVLAYDADAAGQKAAAAVYQWEKKFDVDVYVARFPHGMDPAEFASADPEGLREAVAAAVPFLSFRLDRVLDAAKTETAEGRARAAEAAIRVLAEHPSELVRDQYVITVADRLRLDAAMLRQRVATYQAPPEEYYEEEYVEHRPVFNPLSTPAPGREALRLVIQGHRDVLDRLTPASFRDPVQRRVAHALLTSEETATALASLVSVGDEEAVSLLAVLEMGESATTSTDIDAVVTHVVRIAALEKLSDLERSLRSGAADPQSATNTIRDVKVRLSELTSPDAPRAVQELVAWLSLDPS